MKDNILNTDNSTTTTFDRWSEPYLIDTIVLGDSIELIYRQDSNVTYTVNWRPLTDVKIYKIVFSCKKGKWHVSDNIEGRYISAIEETYEFD